jgi:hypothetical protein
MKMWKDLFIIAMGKEEKIRYKALIILTVIAVITLFVAPSGAFAEMHGFSQNEIEHAKSVQAHHAEDLLRLPGIRGVGIRENLGKLGILILVDDESQLQHIPEAIEDMPTITQIVGEITAHAINLGVSGGNALICSGYCAGGTVGFKVCDNTTAGVEGIITNNHVAASGCPNRCPNNAPLGTHFFSPGVIDNNPVCTTTGATDVGALNRFVPIVLDGVTTNYVDAAFVQSTDTLVSNTIQGLGPQNNTVVAAYLGQPVCKSGRTSGVTCGTVTGINLTINVNYGGACGLGRFSNMIMYSPTPPDTVMSQSGDSGSPVVDSSNNAVALNFAGGDSGDGFGNPMGTVLTQLNVSLCSDIPEPPIDEANGPYDASCAGLTTTVQLSSAGSYDPDPGDVLKYGWITTCPGGTFDDPQSQSPKLTINTSPGCYVACSVTLAVTDSTGNVATDSAAVTIRDTTPPVIHSVSSAPNVLWPPDHKMVNVAVTATATENCDSTPVCTITGVSSTEPVSGLGDGDTAPDWTITGNLNVDLRAECSGIGHGRIYTITVACTDACGNSSVGKTTVTVPHESDLTGNWTSLVQQCENTKCKIKGTLNIQNVGNVDAASSFTRFYLSDDAAYDEGDMLLKQVSTGILKAGNSKNVTLSYSFPIAISATDKYIIAVVDTDNTVVESNKSNNIIVYGPIPKANLKGTWISLTQQCKGTKCKINGTLNIENTGGQDASTSFVRFYLSDDNAYDEGDTFVKQVASGTVRVGKSVNKKLSYTLLSGVTASGKYVIAVLDADDTVEETNESDNVIAFGPIP